MCYRSFGEPHSELCTLTLDALQIPNRLSLIFIFPLCWARGKLGNEKPFFPENVLSNCAVKAQVSVLGYRLLDCEMNFQALILLVMMPPSGVGRTVGCEMVGPSDWMGLETREHISTAFGRLVFASASVLLILLTITQPYLATISWLTNFVHLVAT